MYLLHHFNAGERKPFSGLSSINVLSPLDTSVHLLGVLPDKAKFFASATCPMFMEWKLKSNNDSTAMATSSSGEYKSNSTSNASLSSSSSSSSSSTTSPPLPPTTKIRQLSLASIQQQQLEETIHSAWKEPLTGALLFKTGTDKEPEGKEESQCCFYWLVLTFKAHRIPPLSPTKKQTCDKINWSCN